MAAVVRRALAGASRKLAEPACQELLHDFSDASGRRLDEILAERGRSAAEHLNHLYFYDAPGRLRCDSRSVLAITAVGSHVVFVCPQQLLKDSRRGRSVGEVMVIHELLHSLGLGEDPPSSAAINARVMGRCGL